MIYIVIAFLWASIGLYLLLGGADFGVGIVEVLSKGKEKEKVSEIMYKAIGPIWEANHMWLIIAIVILFVGFPEIYTVMSVHMHIPLVLMLLGIIARGTAFTFRHYDAVHDRLQRLYTRVFTISSIATPFFLGMIAAATVSRSIDRQPQDYLSAYIFSWLNWFGVSIGLFTVAICGYLAAIFSIGRMHEEAIKRLMIRKTKLFIYIVVLCGALVFISAYVENIPLVHWIFGGWPGIVAISLATVSLVLLFLEFKRKNALMLRMLAGFQVLMILLAATYSHFPNIILFKDGSSLSLLEHKGEQKTIDMLGWALMLGSLFILPFLFYLIRIFGRVRKVA